MTGVGSSSALATCETSQVLLAGVSGGFPGVLHTCRLARLNMSEIVLKETLNWREKIMYTSVVQLYVKLKQKKKRV